MKLQSNVTENNLLIQLHVHLGFFFTFAAVVISVTRFAPFVTVASLFVTWSIIQTVTTAIADTVITIGPVITL